MSNSTITYLAGKPEARTSYRNQQLLAARDLPAGTVCIHDVPVARPCDSCRRSGCVLLPAEAVPTRTVSACCKEAVIRSDGGPWVCMNCYGLADLIQVPLASDVL